MRSGWGTYDFVLVNSLLHHLDDDSVSSLLADLRAYVSDDGHIHVIDLELPEQRGIPRALALGIAATPAAFRPGEPC